MIAVRTTVVALIQGAAELLDEQCLQCDPPRPATTFRESGDRLLSPVEYLCDEHDAASELPEGWTRGDLIQTPLVRAITEWQRLEPSLRQLEALLPTLLAWLAHIRSAIATGTPAMALPAALGADLATTIAALGGFTTPRAADAG